MTIQSLTQKLKICIVGSGVVGQATGKVFVEHGFETVFVGGSSDKIEKLRNEGYTVYPKDHHFNGNYDFDITMFTVPTPTKNGKVDLSFLDSASVALGKRLRLQKNYHVVVVKSTVPPGTTEILVKNNVEKYSGRKFGDDLGLCMNPEYLREVNAYDDSMKPWVIVIGEYDSRSGDFLQTVYKKFTCPIYRCSLKEAELQKYVHNVYNATKISFFNEMREIAHSIGANPDRVFKLVAISCEGIWNPSYGIKDKGPFQGSCLPKDTHGLLTWAKENNLPAPLLEAIIEVNNNILKKLGIDQSRLKTALPL